MVILFLIFWGTAVLFSIAIAPFYIEPTVHKGSHFSTCLSTFAISWVCFFKISYQVWGGISLWFWFAFPWWLLMLSISSYACWSFVYFLWRNVYSSPMPILKIKLLSFSRCWIVGIFYILWKLTTYRTYGFAHIFSHSVDCLFTLWTASLAAQFFSLMQGRVVSTRPQVSHLPAACLLPLKWWAAAFYLRHCRRNPSHATAYWNSCLLVEACIQL